MYFYPKKALIQLLHGTLTEIGSNENKSTPQPADLTECLRLTLVSRRQLAANLNIIASASQSQFYA
ncbi:hypothetical protein AZH43_00680 [Acinetobacter pragensis]|uniref:Uncharacterized protein n=1 Tax=Acinetobacter pragensis TaxID=1806892 RepID=A0A151Y6K2_9GAMM|nr:hypothetical protein AZH43_00680 [Acinetobacter pragensis]